MDDVEGQQRMLEENRAAARAAISSGDWVAAAERVEICRRTQETIDRIRRGGYADPSGRPTYRPVRGVRG